MDRPILITLTGPTCSGKSTLESALVSRGASRLTSFTTRQPRTGENPGEDYEFLSFEEFGELQAANALIDYTEHAGHWYGVTGTALNKALAESGVAVWVCDPFGVAHLRQALDSSPVQLLTVYIDNDPSELVRRLLMRFKWDKYGESKDYVRRLMVLLQDCSFWRGMETWDMVFDRLDNNTPGKTTLDAAEDIWERVRIHLSESFEAAPLD